MIISKTLLIILIFIGILLLTIGITKKFQEKPEIINNYIIDNSAFDNQDVSEIFTSMFTESEPWIFSKTHFDRKKQNEINKFFISQA